jgi:hypothetical protein
MALRCDHHQSVTRSPRGGATCFARPSRLLVRADASKDKKPISSIANYFVAVSGSDGFMDVAGGLTCVVECGEKHFVVPKQVARQKEVPVVELTKDEATDFCSRASSTECSVKGLAPHRRTVLAY